MAARGSSAKPVAESKTRRYEVKFSDGKSATCLDMQEEPEAELIRGVTAMFRKGHVISIRRL